MGVGESAQVDHLQVSQRPVSPFLAVPESLQRDGASLGWDLNAWQSGGGLTLHFTSPEVLLASLQDPASPLEQLIHEQDIRRVVLDSATHFARLARDEHDLRRIYAALVNALKREELTALLLAEDRRRANNAPGDGRLGFIVDGILLLRYLEIDSAIQRALVVLKLRGSLHSKEIRSVRIEAGSGLVVGPPFEGRRDLLSGLAHQKLISTVR